MTSQDSQDSRGNKFEGEVVSRNEIRMEYLGKWEDSRGNQKQGEKGSWNESKMEVVAFKSVIFFFQL